MKKLTATLGIVAVLALAGCTSTETPLASPPVITPPAQVETPTPTPTTEAERGSRANPLAPGESRLLADESMWTVGSSGATKVKKGYVLLPLTLGMDWESAQQQADESDDPFNVSEEGVDPALSLYVSYVTAGGRAYTEMKDYSVNVKNDLWQVGTVYPPADSLKLNVAVSVPNDEVDGGVWRIENSRGEGLFIAVE